MCCSSGIVCLHITMIVFGCLDVLAGIFVLFSDDIFTLSDKTVAFVFALSTGLLGIAAGELVGGGGCAGSGCSSAPRGEKIKCAAIMSVINSVIHAAEIVMGLVFIGEVNRTVDSCESTSCEPMCYMYSGCTAREEKLLRQLLLLATINIIWLLISFGICAACAVLAWSTASTILQTTALTHRMSDSHHRDVEVRIRTHGWEMRRSSTLMCMFMCVCVCVCVLCVCAYVCVCVCIFVLRP